MRRNDQSNWRKVKTNRKREFVVKVIGQLCEVIQKGQAQANVQKNEVTQGYL